MSTKLVSMTFISNTIGDKLLVEEIDQTYKKGDIIIDLTLSLKSKLVRVVVLPRNRKVDAKVGELYMITRHAGVSFREHKDAKRYLIIDMVDLQCRVDGAVLTEA